MFPYHFPGGGGTGGSNSGGGGDTVVKVSTDKVATAAAGAALNSRNATSASRQVSASGCISYLVRRFLSM